MRVVDVLKVASLSGLAAGSAPAQPVGQVPLQVFSVVATGPAAVTGRGQVKLGGVAFAVGRDMLLTAQPAIGAAADFRAEPQFGAGGVPRRRIEIIDIGGSAQSFVAAARPSAHRAAVLVRGGPQPPLTPLPLSACAIEDAGHLLRPAAGAEIAVAPVFEAGVATHFRVTQPLAGWNARTVLGAPVLREGRVVGVLTDAAADGPDLEVTPIAAILDVLPDDAEVACDRRVSLRALDDLRGDVATLSQRVRDLDRKLRVQSSRVEVAEQTGRLAMGALADVAEDLAELQVAIGSGGDIEPILDRMSARLQRGVPLLPTVSSIENYLQRPTWRAKAKIEGGMLHLTFSYRTQLPGPRFSDQLRLCMRVVKPFQGDEAGHHDFRTPAFYAAAVQRDTDDEALVRCEQVNVANSAALTDMGEYRFEVWRDDLESLFQSYREGKDWIPPGYEWSGLTYVALIKPGAAAGADMRPVADPQADAVIQRALIMIPDRRGTNGGVVPVECMLFDSDQNVIDFLAQRAPPSGTMGFDDVSDLELDPVNTSDECVLASAQ